MRVVKSCRTALNRQVSEAVRIGRRGGATEVLNSKTEYNRCHIARLMVEDESETKKREETIREEDEQLAKELDKEQQSWEQERTRMKDKERRKTAMAFGSTDVRLKSRKSKLGREELPGSNRKSKRRK